MVFLLYTIILFGGILDLLLYINFLDSASRLGLVGDAQPHLAGESHQPDRVKEFTKSDQKKEIQN